MYESDGTTLIETLNPSIIKNVPSFSSEINGGFGQYILDLNLDFDEFGEGGVIDFMNIVRVYVADANNTLGRLVYTGFISAYSPYVDGAEQGVRVTVLGMVSLLSFAYYKDGASFTVAHAAEDPSDIMKAIIDHFSGVYGAGLITYDVGATTVDSVGVNVTYTFEEKKWLDALKDIFATAGAGWFWVVDKQGQLYLKEKPASATHTFTIGKDIEYLEIPKSSEKVINQVRVKYNGNTADDSDATSITNFGTREKIVSDDQIQNSATADQVAAQTVDDNKDEKIKARLVVNANYDLESIKVGDTCKIRNFLKDATVFNDNMLISGISYSLEKVTIQLEEFTQFAKEILNLTS